MAEPTTPMGDRAGPERFAIVMAGGFGTRFWPASRAARPKQFLALAGTDETLLQATVRRASALCGVEHVLVVTADRHGGLAREQLPDLPSANLLLEPASCNTAPCIAWASSVVRRRAARGVIAALPADPHVADERSFLAALDRAFLAAEGGAIATIGIEPSRPETGYGYLERGEAVSEGVHRVSAFIEKPDLERAQIYARSGRHLWNSGMFLFRVDVILAEIERHLPELGMFVNDCDQAAARHEETAFIASRYEGLPRISIDYGVMEKAQGIVVVPASFGWDDLGSWSAAWALARRDGADNATRGDVLALDSTGCFVSAPRDKLVVLLGAEDMVVVDTPDALLIVPRDRAQEVGQVVNALKQAGRADKV
ncbi:MAG: mannose-1-phosphate guanylyltransferase [Polyangiales bacterium]